MTDMTQLPVTHQPSDNLDFGLGSKTSPALQVFLNEKLFDRARTIAGYMSKAEGAIPKHLIGKMEACFAIFTRSISWRLDPFMVASATYQTPGGSIGYEGKLCQAILENSGMVEGQIIFEHFHSVTVKPKKPADATPITVHSNDSRLEQWRKEGAAITNSGGTWDDLVGKFEMIQSQSGRGKYPVAKWDDKLEIGLGVTVKVQVKGDRTPREFTFYLVQAEPRNSTLWVTDPRTQICYLAIRRFSSVAAPGIFMGVPFDREDWDEDARARNARDITPQTSSNPSARPSAADQARADGTPVDDDVDPPSFVLVDETGELECTCPMANQWIQALLAASAPTPDGKFTDRARAYLVNNAEAFDAIMGTVPDLDMALVGRLQARYAAAEEAAAAETAGPDDAEQTAGHTDGQHTVDGASTGATQIKEPSAPLADAAADVGPAIPPAGPKQTPAGGGGAAKTPAAPPAAVEPEGPKPIPFPVDPQTQKPSATMYLIGIQQELLLATTPEQIDMVIARERPNIHGKNVKDGTRRSIDMFVRSCKNKMLEGGA